jgi:hypothetical protein
MPSRKTHDEDVAELAVKNPGVTVVGEYVNTHTKIDHLCNGCGSLWSVSPKNAMNTKTCKTCALSKLADSTRQSHDKYVAQLAVKNPDVTVVGEYVNARTKIDHQCRCGEVWSVAPYSLIDGNSKGCKSCGHNSTKTKRRKTHDQFASELLEKHEGVEAVGVYVNAKTKIKFRCAKGHEWNATPDSVLAGSGCGVCAGNIKRSHDSYLDALKAKNKDILPIDEYADALTPIRHRCAVGHEWTATPANILFRTSCPHCAETTTDANVFYIWENTQDPGVYKVGITSERCADERIAICTRKNGMTANVILMAHTPRARDIERRALELGDDPRYPDTIDGYTEFRRYSDAELGEVWRMAVGA